MDHAARRARLAERFTELGVDAFLVTHLPNVLYLTGFSGSNGLLLLARSDGLFLTDGRYVEQSRHEVPDLPRAVHGGPFARAVATACEQLGVARLAFEATHVTYHQHAGLTDLSAELVPTVEVVEELRAIKDADERAALAAAQAIADDAFEVIVAKLVEGATERDTALELEVAMRRFGAEAVSFDTIMAFGENAAEPHHSPTARALSRGDVVKMDFGCMVDGYHSDMTRTVAFGEPSARLREVYEVVRLAQRAGVAAVRAGASCGEVDRATRDLISEAGFGEQYRHPVGHGVGLEIHERPWLRPQSEDPLPEGAVVTVEPGIYLEGEGGVRIEDMVEVTAQGGRVVSTTTKDLIVL